MEQRRVLGVSSRVGTPSPDRASILLPPDVSAGLPRVPGELAPVPHAHLVGLVPDAPLLLAQSLQIEGRAPVRAATPCAGPGPGAAGHAAVAGGGRASAGPRAGPAARRCCAAIAHILIRHRGTSSKVGRTPVS